MLESNFAAYDVLIVSDLDDVHSIGVANAVKAKGFNPLILNNANFPQKIALSHYIENSEINSCLTLDTDEVLWLHKLKGVWWRRPNSYKPISTLKHPVLRRFVHNECKEAFIGALISTNDNFINPIGGSRYAVHKLEQLKRAKDIGLSIPKTLVSTDKVRIETFLNDTQKSIYKTFKGTSFGFYETRSIKEDDMAHIEKFEHCPTILQEEIIGDLDIRVTIIDNQIFPAEIHYKKGKHKVDGRIDRVPVKSHQLPQIIGEKLIALVRSYGLRYSAIDLRYSKDKGYTFFELNPEGQFLWIEIETGQEICSAIADALLFGRPKL